MEFFEELLKELSKSLGTALHVDEHHTCAIRFKNRITVQLEADRAKENVIIGAELGELAPGKFRDLILKEALIANNEPPPRYGILAYNHKKRSLVLFEQLPTQNLTAEKLTKILSQIVPKAELWQEAVSKRQLPPKTPKTPELPPPPFGFRP